MTDLSEKLSAYLDGELDEAEMAAIQARLETDADAQAELDLLLQADAAAREEFDAQLADPVPFALAQQIKAADLPERPANVNAPARPVWGALVAGLVLFVMGGAGGYLLRGPEAPVETAGWLADIADYHAVYASQGRHLVEVSADEADHIETWLGDQTGVNFSIPDLTAFGLTFEGGRLLVANAKPVAQLMYRQPDGTVIALCLQESNREGGDAPAFNERTINGFDFVSWTEGGADYVVIGPEGEPDLTAIARDAAVEI